jgi:hypothetical protein
MPAFFVPTWVVSTYKNLEKIQRELLGVIWEKIKLITEKQPLYEKHHKTLNIHSSHPHLWQT